MPNRMLSGELARSESLSRVSLEAELTFVHLITVVDDFGRFDGRPVILLAALYPTRAGAISIEALTRWLAELEGEGLVRWYMAGGRRYLEIPTWRKHQRVRAARSKWPEPEPEVSPSPNQRPQTTRREPPPLDRHSRSSAAESRESRVGVEDEKKIEHVGGVQGGRAADAAPATPEPLPASPTEPPSPEQPHANGKPKRAARVLELPPPDDELWADLAAACPQGALADPMLVRAWAEIKLPAMRARGRKTRQTIADWWSRVSEAELRQAGSKLARERAAEEQRAPPIAPTPEQVNEVMSRLMGPRTRN